MRSMNSMFVLGCFVNRHVLLSWSPVPVCAVYVLGLHDFVVHLSVVRLQLRNDSPEGDI